MKDDGIFFSGLKTGIYILSFLLVSFTVLPFFRMNSWWIRLGDFPRVQIASLAVIVILAMILFLRPFNLYNLSLILVLFLCVCYQIYCIAPYLPIYRYEVQSTDEDLPGKPFKLFLSNVLIDNEDASKLVSTIREEDPDVIFLAEPNQRWIDDIGVLKKDYPYSVEKPLDNAYGMALYSRLRLKNTKIRYLVEDDIPSIHTDIELSSGDWIRFFGVHPRPPVPGESERSTERDAELVLVGDIARNTEKPTIVAGDLNDVAWSRTTGLFQKVSGLLDPRVGRGLYNSFHAEYAFLRFPLDHVFHSSHFRLVELKRLPYIGSDHFPLLVVLNLESDAKRTHETPVPDRNELKQANQIVQEAEDVVNKPLANIGTDSNKEKNNIGQ